MLKKQLEKKLMCAFVFFKLLKSESGLNIYYAWNKWTLYNWRRQIIRLNTEGNVWKLIIPKNIALNKDEIIGTWIHKPRHAFLI